MKTNRCIRIAAALLMVVFHPDRAAATNVGTGLVYQLAYLGAASQPDRIPLAPVITRSNYGYGTYGLISQPRPCYHGHFLADGKPEYEQNLAVLFGISFNFSDETQMPGSTLTIRIKPCKPPSNAPYSQEQVTAAALQTVLWTAYGLSKESPMTVVIEGDGMPAPEWASKYAKPYFREDPDNQDVPIPVPGVGTDQNSLGVRSIIFNQVAANPAIERRDPAFVPFTSEGEGDNEGVLLVPVWHGDVWAEPMNVLIIPNLPYYERWHGQGESTESVAIPHMAPPNPILGPSEFKIKRPPGGGTWVVPRDHDFSPTELAALIHACITTIQPTADCPLTFSLAESNITEEYQDVLRQNPAWKDGQTCEFVFDPSTLKLLKGSVPDFSLENRYGYLRVYPDTMRRINETDPPIPDWIKPSIQYIRDLAPPPTEMDFTEAKQHPETLLRDTDPASTKDDEQRIRGLLALWKSDTDADQLKSIWQHAIDRKTRAIAVQLAQSKHFQVTGSNQVRIGIDQELLDLDEWDRARRREETHFRTSEAIQSAVTEWEQRGKIPGETPQD